MIQAVRNPVLPVNRVEVSKGLSKKEPIIEKVKKEKQVKASIKIANKKYRSPYSLENILKKESKKAELESELLGGEDMPKTPFGKEQLDEHWKLFVQNHVDKKNRSLFTTLNQRSPELKPNFKLVFVIENNVQLNQIDMIKVDLVNYLRKHLNNYSITFETPIKKIESKRHVYTDEEKYKSMAEKYPLIEKLREKLDLDLDH